MRVALLVALAVVLPASVEGAARTPPAKSGTVLTATWTIGGRFDRTEWFEPRTGSTRREDVGGPACVRTTVVGTGRMVWFGCFRRQMVGVLRSTYPQLVWLTSDLLRPLRLLKLRQASVVGLVQFEGRTVLRVQLPVHKEYGEGPPDATHYADLDPKSKLPVRFVFERPGATFEYRIRLRRIPRASLPWHFFSPTKSF